MSSPEDAPENVSPHDSLPPVEPPSAAFLVQLFVIPLAIVAIIVGVWLMFSWLAHMGTTPESYVKALSKSNKGSWQAASSLADLMRNPRNENLKRDPKLAKQLADALSKQIATRSAVPNSIRLRMFLCRALGEFYVVDGMPALLEAATTENKLDELDVRITAVESLAVLIGNVGSKRALENSELLPTLLQAAKETSDRLPTAMREAAASRGKANPESIQLVADQKAPPWWIESIKRAQLRSRAAFALGVLGGDEALNRLQFMLVDVHPNTRYNAATGLARHGDARGVDVLIDMLNASGDENPNGERNSKARAWKSALVIHNGLQAAKQLSEKNSADDLGSLKGAVEDLLEKDVAREIRADVQVQAKAILKMLAKRHPSSGTP